MQRKEFNPQIIRIDGRDSFLEVTNGMFHLDVIVLRFIKYDNKASKGNKYVHDISIFLTFAEFLVLKNDVMSGRMPKELKNSKMAAQASGHQYPKAVYSTLGGKSVKKFNDNDRKLMQKYGNDPKMSISRQFKIAPGQKEDYPFVLSAEWGIGEQTQKGIIIPRYKKPSEIVRVPMSANSMKQLILTVESHINAFNAAYYMMELMNPTPKKEFGNNKSYNHQNNSMPPMPQQMPPQMMNNVGPNGTPYPNTPYSSQPLPNPQYTY